MKPYELDTWAQQAKEYLEEHEERCRSRRAYPSQKTREKVSVTSFFQEDNVGEDALLKAFADNEDVVGPPRTANVDAQTEEAMAKDTWPILSEVIDSSDALKNKSDYLVYTLNLVEKMTEVKEAYDAVMSTQTVLVDTENEEEKISTKIKSLWNFGPELIQMARPSKKFSVPNDGDANCPNAICSSSLTCDALKKQLVNLKDKMSEYDQILLGWDAGNSKKDSDDMFFAHKGYIQKVKAIRQSHVNAVSKAAKHSNEELNNIGGTIKSELGFLKNKFATDQRALSKEIQSELKSMPLSQEIEPHRQLLIDIIKAFPPDKLFSSQRIKENLTAPQQVMGEGAAIKSEANLIL